MNEIRVIYFYDTGGKEHLLNTNWWYDYDCVKMQIVVNAVTVYDSKVKGDEIGEAYAFIEGFLFAAKKLLTFHSHADYRQAV